MSSKGRNGSVSEPADFYRTPIGAVRRLVEAATDPALGEVGQRVARFLAALRAGPVAEFNAGEGDLIDHFNDLVGGILWHAVELRPEATCMASRHVAVGSAGSRIETGNCFDAIARARRDGTRYSASPMNPAFTIAHPLTQGMLEICDWVCILERAQWPSDDMERLSVYGGNMPDELRIGRLDFTGEGGDSTVYSWFLWGPETRGRRVGQIAYLPRPDRPEARGRKPTATSYQLSIL